MIKVTRKKPATAKQNLLFALSKEEKELLKKVPRNSFSKFKEGNATATDWYNVFFRIKLAASIAKEFYTEETQSEINPFCDMMIRIKDRSEQSGWKINEEELLSIEDCLDACDTMSDETTRKQQLPHYKTTYTYLKQFIA